MKARILHLIILFVIDIQYFNVKMKIIDLALTFSILYYICASEFPKLEIDLYLY